MKKMNKGIGGHHSASMRTDDWITPPEILHPLGEFDLDPCASVNQPWPTARHHFTIEDNGLLQEWFGRVWLNPPYGNDMGPWLKKIADHGDGISLIFARTETRDFFKYVWPYAYSILFLEGRLYFHNSAGMRAKANSGAPSVLISYNEKNSESLSNSGLKGKHLPVNSLPIIVVGISPTWTSVITIALNRLKGTGSVQAIYEMVERIAPDKVQNNPYYKEKIRQKLQTCFERISKGIYTITTENI